MELLISEKFRHDLTSSPWALNILKYVVMTDFENRHPGGQRTEAGALGGAALPSWPPYHLVIRLARCLFDATHTGLQETLGSGKALLLS